VHSLIGEKDQGLHPVVGAPQGVTGALESSERFCVARPAADTPPCGELGTCSSGPAATCSSGLSGDGVGRSVGFKGRFVVSSRQRSFGSPVRCCPERRRWCPPRRAGAHHAVCLRSSQVVTDVTRPDSTAFGTPQTRNAPASTSFALAGTRTPSFWSVVSADASLSFPAGPQRPADLHLSGRCPVPIPVHIGLSGDFRAHFVPKPCPLASPSQVIAPSPAPAPARRKTLEPAHRLRAVAVAGGGPTRLPSAGPVLFSCLSLTLRDRGTPGMVSDLGAHVRSQSSR
jgi:hypothetical protein